MACYQGKYLAGAICEANTETLLDSSKNVLHKGAIWVIHSGWLSEEQAPQSSTKSGMPAVVGSLHESSANRCSTYTYELPLKYHWYGNPSQVPTIRSHLIGWKVGLTWIPLIKSFQINIIGIT